MIPITEAENQKSLLNYIQKEFVTNGKSTVVLLDADRTIYEPDTSRILNKKANIDLSEIKQGFKKWGYSYKGFYLMNQIYSRIDPSLYLKLAEEIARTIEFYPGVESFLKESQYLADIIIVSSGIKAIVDSVFNMKGLSVIPRIGGTHFQIDDFLIGRNEKKLICEYFKSKNKKIVAFGDSDVDSLMLQNAHHAVMVVNHRNNQDLFPHLKYHPAVSQISFKEYIHPGIPKTSFRDFINTHPHLFSNKN